MIKFISSLNLSSPILPPVVSELPIADDGYLYVLAFGQSNMTGGYPTDVNDDQYAETGDTSNPTKTYVPTGGGKWKLAKYDEPPFLGRGNNIAFSFCKKMEELFDVPIRLTHSWAGGRSIQHWFTAEMNTAEVNVPNYNDKEMWTDIRNHYLQFYKFGRWSDQIRKASVVIMHQGEANSSITSEVWAYNSTETYIQDWQKVIQLFKDNEFIVSDNLHFIFGEIIFSDNVLDLAQSGIVDLSQTHILALSDGLALDNAWHFCGKGHHDFGIRYAEKYKKMLDGTPYGDESRPSLPEISFSNLNEDNFQLSWTASQSNNNIVSYKIISGVDLVSEVNGNVLSGTFNWTVDKGAEQRIQVVGVDSNGRESRRTRSLYVTSAIRPGTPNDTTKPATPDFDTLSFSNGFITIGGNVVGGDNTTANNDLVFKLYDSENLFVLIGSASTNSNINFNDDVFTIDNISAPSGDYNFSISVTDEEGNESFKSSVLSITIST